MKIEECFMPLLEYLLNLPPSEIAYLAELSEPELASAIVELPDEIISLEAWEEYGYDLVLAAWAILLGLADGQGRHA